MKQNIFFLLASCIFIFLSHCIGSGGVNCTEIAAGEQIFGPKLVKEYENYGHVALFRFRLPQHVIWAKWQISKAFSSDDCDNLPMKVAIEAGRLPIINPYNSTFPENTRLPTQGANHFTISENDTHISLESIRVYPGDWFIVVFREKENNRIKQAGLSTSCHYFAEASMVYEMLMYVETLGNAGKELIFLDETSTSVLYKFLVESNMATLSFVVDDCVSWSGNKSHSPYCPIQMFAKPSILPLPGNGSHNVTCLESDKPFAGCSLDIPTTKRDTWYYLNVTKIRNDPPLKIELNLTVNVTVCKEPANTRTVYEVEVYDRDSPPPVPLEAGANFAYSVTSDNFTSASPNPSATPSTASLGSTMRSTPQSGDNTDIMTTPSITTLSPSDNDVDVCPDVDFLSTDYGSGSITKIFYSIMINTSMVYHASSGIPFVASFDLDIDDVGGVLILETKTISEKLKTQNVTSVLCLQHESPPLWNGTSLACQSDMLFLGNVTQSIATFHYPFPSQGRWYAGLYTTCTEWHSASQSHVPVLCNRNLTIALNLMMSPCVNGCGDNGRCEIHNQDGLLFYACKCSNDYIGWGCTDDSQVDTSKFLLTVLLLTLSNLIFLLDAILCLYRRYYPEAVSFVATCFFSTMYHACDSSPVCITDYDTLQFSDFFASFMSVLLILIAMARLPHPLKSTLHIVGAYALAFFAQWDRFSLWSIAVPLGAGILTLIISWGVRMYKRRKLYPSPMRWILFIIPGTLLAVAGLVVNAAFETDENYYWVHSTWHLCMGLGVLFIMPPRDRKCKNEYHPMSELVDINALNTELLQDDPGY